MGKEYIDIFGNDFDKKNNNLRWSYIVLFKSSQLY